MFLAKAVLVSASGPRGSWSRQAGSWLCSWQLARIWPLASIVEILAAQMERQMKKEATSMGSRQPALLVLIRTMSEPQRLARLGTSSSPPPLPIVGQTSHFLTSPNAPDLENRDHLGKWVITEDSFTENM